MTGKIDHDCEIEGCTLPWEFYLYCGPDTIVEVCKKHKYELIIARTTQVRVAHEAGIDTAGMVPGDCDFFAMSRKEVEGL